MKSFTKFVLTFSLVLAATYSSTSFAGFMCTNTMCNYANMCIDGCPKAHLFSATESASDLRNLQGACSSIKTFRPNANSNSCVTSGHVKTVKVGNEIAYVYRGFIFDNQPLYRCLGPVNNQSQLSKSCVVEGAVH